MKTLDAVPQETVVVVFKIGGESYGISVDKVREVILPPSVTRLPSMPVFLEGIIRLRGYVIPIVDLRVRFGREAVKHDGCRTLVVTMSGRTVGFNVDEVNAVRRIPSRTIRPLPPDVPRAGKEFLAGVAPGEGGDEALLLLLDVEKILTLDERNILMDVGRS